MTHPIVTLVTHPTLCVPRAAFAATRRSWIWTELVCGKSWYVARCHLDCIFRFEECRSVSKSPSLQVSLCLLLVPTSSAECFSHLDAAHPHLSPPPVPQLSLFLVLAWQCGCRLPSAWQCGCWLPGRLAYQRHRARRLCVGGQGRRGLRVTERHCAHRQSNVLVLAPPVLAARPVCCIVCRHQEAPAIGTPCHPT